MQMLLQATPTVVQNTTNQQPDGTTKAGQQMTPFAGGLVIGLILGYWGHILTSSREARNRTRKEKDVFGVFIREQTAGLPQSGVREFYDRTKPSIRDAVQRVWHFFGDEQRTRLDRLWQEYDSIPAQELDRRHEGTMGEVMRDLYRIPNPPVEFQTPYEIVKYYLDQFYKFSV